LQCRFTSATNAAHQAQPRRYAQELRAAVAALVSVGNYVTVDGSNMPAPRATLPLNNTVSDCQHPYSLACFT
jgi:hypothetical protein